MIERARKLAAAAAGAGGSIRLVEYPDAGHAFAIKRFPKNWRGNDATDAFRKTLDYLNACSVHIPKVAVTSRHFFLQAQGFVDGERLLCTVLPPC